MRKLNIGGYTVLIDDEDYGRIKHIKWRPIMRGRKHKRIYFINDDMISLHRYIMNLDKNIALLCDHIDGDTLNNKKSNLRACTKIQNVYNSKMHSNNKSGLKGIWQRRNKWRSEIRHDGIREYLGTFDTKEEAYNAYCIASKKYHKEYGRIA